MMTALEEALSTTIGQSGDDPIKRAMAQLLILLLQKIQLGEGTEEEELAKEIGKTVFEKKEPSRINMMIPSPS